MIEENMALDDAVNWEQMYTLVSELGIRGYEMRYFDVCSALWKSKVPESGQADTLCAELLREVEKLRSEAQDNGNLNWDSNFAFFCENLKQAFEGSKLFDVEKLCRLCKLLDYVKDCGEYACAYNNGEIPEEIADPVRFAYVDDDLYDYLGDAVAEMLLSCHEDTPYQKKDFVYR